MMWKWGSGCGGKVLQPPDLVKVRLGLNLNVIYKLFHEAQLILISVEGVQVVHLMLLIE